MLVCKIVISIWTKFHMSILFCKTWYLISLTNSVMVYTDKKKSRSKQNTSYNILFNRLSKQTVKISSKKFSRKMKMPCGTPSQKRQLFIFKLVWWWVTLPQLLIWPCVTTWAMALHKIWKRYVKDFTFSKNNISLTIQIQCFSCKNIHALQNEHHQGEFPLTCVGLRVSVSFVMLPVQEVKKWFSVSVSISLNQFLYKRRKK